jgi:DNA polymerase III delta prime subunit
MEKLWVERYRPKNLNDYIFQTEEIKDLCNSFVKNQEIPNLLLSGIHGTGKSTLARILINEMGVSGSDLRRLNASTESGIDVVREKIETFCKNSISLSSPFKIILLEEAGRLSKDAQNALKDVTEIYSDHCRFIFTCNDPTMIIPELHSRFQEIEFNTIDEDAVFERIGFILDEENIQVNDGDDIVDHVEAFYPDLRKIIQTLQQNSVTGTLKPLSMMGCGDVDIEWSEIWKNKPDFNKLETLLPNLDYRNVESYYRIMYENASKLKKSQYNAAIQAIAEHLYRSYTIADQEINLHACLITIFYGET